MIRPTLLALSLLGGVLSACVPTDDLMDAEFRQSFYVSPDGLFSVRDEGNGYATYSWVADPSWPSGGTFYNCKDWHNDCYPSTLVNGAWEYTHINIQDGQTYNAWLKIPGWAEADFPQYTFTWTPGGATAPADTGEPATGGPVDTGTPATGGTTEPVNDDFSHLDWTSNSLLSGKGTGPGPRANPPRALPTPTGMVATSHGFAFSIGGSVLTWSWGPNIIKGPGDSGLQMHCSEDGGATFTSVNVIGGSANIPCDGVYDYFFRYEHPTHSLNNNPAHRWLYTGLYTTEGATINPANYDSFTDGSANWMRFRHPISHDGTTAAVLDAQHNNDRLRNLDRYLVWVDDSPGNVQLGLNIAGNLIRNESMRNTAGGPNGQQFFAVNQNPGFGGVYSYGQVIQFELTAVAGGTGAQTYNDFSYYTVGYGWGNYGDPRLNSAGRAGTTMVLSDGGAYTSLEKNAIFTQPMTTLHSEVDMDDFILGHHLFHGIDPNAQGSTQFDAVLIGADTCGGCHFRDGRGFEVIQTADGPRIAPPIFGVGLLEAIENRPAGFTWDGLVNSVDDQVENALVDDHGVQPADLPSRVLELLKHYTKVITVPNRDPAAYDTPGVADGDVLFTQVGCAECHTPIQNTSSTNDAYDNLVIRPYTDMDIWNVNGGYFRTAPLWGLGHNMQLLSDNGLPLLLMHDGSATTVDGAIQLHSDDAANARDNYNALSATQRGNLVSFVETL